MSAPMNDPERESRLIQRRVSVALVVVFLMASVLIARAVYLQHFQHEKFSARSDANRIQLEPLAPTRGLIYDRKGRLLAENIPSHSLAIVPERVPDLDATLTRLSEIIDIDEDDLESFERRRKSYRRPFEPVALKTRLSDDDIAKLWVNAPFLQGVEVRAELSRSYPYGQMFYHTLGYVGRINERDQERIANAERNADYVGTDFIGKIGIERVYEDELLGKPGYQQVETNAHGRIIKVLGETAPIPGKSLELFLDTDIQKAAYDAMQDRRGAVVAIEVETGGILSMLSMPTVDPNLFVAGIPASIFNPLRDSLDRPFTDRAARGAYPPASTLKPFIGLAGVAVGATTWERTINDPGFYQIPGEERRWRDWTWATRRDGHGSRVDLADAVIESCDVYYYDLAFKMKLENMHSYLDAFGFGQTTAVDVFSPVDGINPTRAWKEETRGLPWFPGDSINLGIGQGYITATPLQLAVATTVLARRGSWVAPRLAKSIDGVPTPSEIDMPDIEGLTERDWDLMFKAMEDVVYGAKGTARAAGFGMTYKMAGKTGTAQVISRLTGTEGLDPEEREERQKSHALFIAFAPVEDPKVAVAVIVENGESGGRAAAPVAKAVFDAYLAGEERASE
ncbi:penicillin-binding protein 2 [Salinibius halmophilus]|uniref:penicillin-binding protein 2 n=1 Tax=Salinibius halmophilus TaxID=1853216 RepID=UPI001F46DD1A|nr:penicillin-binding protein 2 [Salinibius halmophilus]